MHVTKRKQCKHCFFLSQCCVIYEHKHRNWFTCVCLCSSVCGGHYEDGRRCHGATVFVAMQAFSATPLSLRQRVLLLQRPFQESGASRKLNGKRRRWNQEVNVRRIISTFTHNWEHTVWLLGLMKSLWLCVATIGSDVLFHMSIRKLNAAEPRMQETLREQL